MWIGDVRTVQVWNGMAVLAWLGRVWCGSVRSGKAVTATQGSVWLGVVRYGMAVKEWQGTTRRGKPWRSLQPPTTTEQYYRCSTFTGEMKMLTPEQMKELSNLEAKGKLTPNAVVELARKPENPLHEFFDWDDETAAHSYRIDQARSLIRSVRIEVIVKDDTIKVPQYLHNPGLQGQGYVSVARLKNDKEMAVEAVLRELSQADAAMRRAIGIASSLGVEKEIRSIRDAVKEGTEAVERIHQEARLSA